MKPYTNTRIGTTYTRYTSTNKWLFDFHSGTWLFNNNGSIKTSQETHKHLHPHFYFVYLFIFMCVVARFVSILVYTQCDDVVVCVRPCASSCSWILVASHLSFAQPNQEFPPGTVIVIADETLRISSSLHWNPCFCVYAYHSLAYKVRLHTASEWEHTYTSRLLTYSSLLTPHCSVFFLSECVFNNVAYNAEDTDESSIVKVI